ncbi:hypothetical protein Tco_0454862 [Tanacetum coccineum]
MPIIAIRVSVAVIIVKRVLQKEFAQNLASSHETLGIVIFVKIVVFVVCNEIWEFFVLSMPFYGHGIHSCPDFVSVRNYCTLHLAKNNILRPWKFRAFSFIQTKHLLEIHFHVEEKGSGFLRWSQSKKSWGKESAMKAVSILIHVLIVSFIEFVQPCFLLLQWLPLMANLFTVSGIVIAEPGVGATTRQLSGVEVGCFFDRIEPSVSSMKSNDSECIQPEAVESSSRNVDTSNMHELYQRHPLEYHWTKDHLLVQVFGNPSKPLQTRRQLDTDPEMCMFALIVSTAEPKNIRETMVDHASIEAMQEGLHQFKILGV